jgi:methylated-DNA-protein-cysteine methyltransferase related protein
VSPPARFFERVYALVSRIPRGKVMTYGDVAWALGHPGAARAVGWALRSLSGREARIPWFRVLGHGGRISLPGLSGERQRRCLRAEGVRFQDGRVDMARHAAVTRGRADARGLRRTAGSR